MLMSNTLLLERVIKRKGKHSGNGKSKKQKVKAENDPEWTFQDTKKKRKRRGGKEPTGAQRSRRLAQSMKIIR